MIHLHSFKIYHNRFFSWPYIRFSLLLHDQRDLKRRNTSFFRPDDIIDGETKRCGCNVQRFNTDGLLNKFSLYSF